MSTPLMFADFEAISEGDIAELKHFITAEDVAQFARLTGDTNPLHTDMVFARRTKFRAPVVHGMLSASFISTVIGTLLPGNGALWLSQSIDFRLPARVGDQLKIQATVKQKSPSQRVLRLETLIRNQRDEIVVSGEAKVQMLEDLGVPMTNGKVASVAIVTGASRGIGAAIARKLADDGLKVVVNYVRNQERAQQVIDDIRKSGGEAVSFKADVTVEKEVQALVNYAVQSYGTVDVLINNATINTESPSFDLVDWSELLRHIDVHLKGAFLCSQRVLPIMVAQKFGHIVNLGSVAADNVPPGKQVGYVVAKSSLVGLSKCMATEFGPKGVRVNVVAPGMTETELISSVPQRTRLTLEMQTPLRRLAQPEDIADVVAFLVSPGARFITGETIHVCGGQVML